MKVRPYHIVIAKLMARGLTLKEISAKTKKNEKTIATYMCAAYRDNKCKNSTQFIYQMAKAKLI